MTKKNNMPIYPDFCKIDLHHKVSIEKITQTHPPACDFNFSNLYFWSDPKNETTISTLYGNLVVKMLDFTSNKTVVSYIGKNDLYNTVNTLIQDYPEITMVPKSSIDHKVFNSSKWKVQEDRNNHDYILSLEDLAKLIGKKYKSKRQKVNTFSKNYRQTVVEEIDISNTSIQKDIKNLFTVWQKNTNAARKEVNRELEAIERLARISHKVQLFNLGLYDNDRMIGFTTNEIVRKDTVNGNFGKADTFYKGIYAYLEYMNAKALEQKGYKFFNYEQDLGIPSLRETKLGWRPIGFIKKFTIQKRYV